MVTLTISLSKEQKAFIDAQVKARGLESASVYLSQLVLIEQLKPDRSRIEALLLEGLNSGPSTPLTRQDWEDIEREGLALLAEENKNGGERQKKPRRPKRSA